jgi:hypothetical protein
MTYSVNSDSKSFGVINSDSTLVFKQPEHSEWTCHLFGGTSVDGLSWTPPKGKEPNRFWRWMQYLCFGNRWVKTSQP